MKAQHTPGPWSLEYDYSLVMKHHIVTAGPIGPDEASQEEKKANARLIAAAPELLEALKAIVELNIFNDSIKGFDKAQRAILKATQP